MNMEETAMKAFEASKKLAIAETAKKNNSLLKMAALLEENKKELVAANKKDIENAAENKISENLVRRLKFDEKKVEGRIQSLKQIADLDDPVGQIIKMSKRPRGILVGRMRVPLGVILMIYEARPHVTVNAGAFALKSGNAVILKGGKEAQICNELIGKLWKEALLFSGLPENCIQAITATHEEIDQLLVMPHYINLVIPRGGEKLIQSVVSKSKIPVIKHFKGVCHVYVDETADLKKAVDITLNSKLLMPEVCNAAETLLVHQKSFNLLPDIIQGLQENEVEIRGCEKTQQIGDYIKPAEESDWSEEYLDKIMAVKVVEDIEAAIDHINHYGTSHTDSIVSENYSNTQRFVKEVDSSVVLVNASTMFDDGEELGMGAEIGISTDKLHARGPMGLEELTSYKFVVIGNGDIKEA